MHFAKVPIVAIIESTEITPSAFRLYVYFCLRRNKHTGVCFPTLRRAADDLKINYSYACTMRKELVTKGWIELFDGRFIRPLKGFEIPNSSIEIPNISEDVEYLEIPNIGIEIPNPSIEIPNTYLEIPNHNREITDNLTDKGTEKREARTSKPKRDAGRRWGDDEIVPEDWKIKATIDFPLIDIDLETKKFENYWASMTGRTATKRNWKRTYENWMIKANEYASRYPQKRQIEKTTLEDHYDYWERREKEADGGGHTDKAPSDKWLGDG